MAYFGDDAFERIKEKLNEIPAKVFTEIDATGIEKIYQYISERLSEDLNRNIDSANN